MKSKNLIFIIFISCSFVGTFLHTALVVALPGITNDFNIPMTTGQLLISIYSLIMGILTPITAFLIKRYKTRNLHLIAIIFYIMGLALASLTDTFAILLLGRLMQALGTGVILTLTQVVILTIFPLEKRGTAMGIYGLVLGLAPVIAPTLAGIIIDNYNWRYIFIIALVLMIIFFIASLISMKNVLENEETSFDFVSFLLSSIGFSLFLIGIGNISLTTSSLITALLPMILGLIILFFFVSRQLKIKDPLLEMRTFINYEFRISVIMSCIVFMVLISTSTLMPIYLQRVKGLTATGSGLVMLPGSMLMAVVSPVAGKFYDRFGIRMLSIVSSASILFGCIGLSFVDSSTPVIYISTLYAMRVLGLTLTMMPLVTWGLSTLSSVYISHGSALILTLRSIAGAFGSALFVAVMQTFSRTATGSGGTADARGINAAFIGISIIAIGFLLLSVFKTQNRMCSN